MSDTEPQDLEQQAMAAAQEAMLEASAFSDGSDEFADKFSEVADATREMAESMVQPISFGPLDPPSGSAAASGDKPNLDLLLDVTIPISVEVGASQMALDEILRLAPGSIVPLDKKAEEPIDLRVNGKLVAQGEVVLIDDTYGLRITQIVDPTGRIESLR